MPIKKTSNKSLLFKETSLDLKRMYPINRLKHAHNVFTNGEESPFPCGLENGVGNLSPEIPWIKCGTAFVKNDPAKNAAR
jgi:hypothetical protein